MDRQKLMASLPTIGGNALKLYVHHNILGLATPPEAELQRVLGMSRASYFRAKAECEAHGLSLIPETPVSPVRPQSLAVETPSLIPETDSLITATDRLTDETLRLGIETLSRASETLPPPHSHPQVFGDEKKILAGFAETASLRTRAAEADRMDMSGDPTQTGSPFQARRRAQVKVLQDAWVESGLPASLQEQSARTWLSWTPSAEDLLGRLEETAAAFKAGKVRSPFSYLNKVFQAERAKLLAPIDAQSTPGTPSPSASTNYAAGTIIYLPRDERYLAKQREMEELAKALLTKRAAARGEQPDFSEF